MQSEEPKQRPSFEDIYMSLAHKMSERSTCRRLNVGCTIVTPDFRKVLAVGYNGNAAGCANDCDRHGEAAVGNCGCLHAEENAVINCDVTRSTRKIVFCTHLPCLMCAKRLINLGGVEHVYYDHDYRNHDSLDLLTSVKIEVEQFTPRIVRESNEAREKLERDYHQVVANLTSVQERCTELLLENRKLRGIG